MEPYFLLPPLPGDEAPWSILGIALHFIVVLGITYVMARCLWRHLHGSAIAATAVFFSFGLGFLWRHISWDFWATWDDLIIDPFKQFQFLHPRGENIACLVAFTLAPFLLAWWRATGVIKRMKESSQSA